MHDPLFAPVQRVCARVVLTLIVLCAWISVQSVAAQPATATFTVEGVSVDVQDGDTFVMRDAAGRPMRIRVAGIDAPEKSQPWADRSRLHLRGLLRDQRIQVHPIKQDIYGRTVARVNVLRADQASLDAAQAQIDAGLAWHFKRYKSDQTREEFVRYAQAEREARAAGIGLWSQADPQPPWVFRAANRSAAQRSGSAARDERP